MRLVQIRKENTRRVGIVEEPRLHLLDNCESVYALVEEAIATGETLGAVAQRRATGELVDYDSIYRGTSEWRLLVPVDHPRESARCLVSGTGLTHLGSARERQAMHVKNEDLTDSMKMFRWGIEGGRPAAGQIGTAPEWFYKGTGTILRAHGEALETPTYAEDGGEEAEIAGIYLVDAGGVPRRVGMTVGNEFSDHKFEKQNYLNLASSKIRTCAIGPELVLDADFQSVSGEVAIERGTSVLWTKQIRTGEAEMCHSLRNIEHHHFKFDTHRRPGDVHVHFLGADCLSFGEGIELRDGDIMQVRFEGFGRALRNPVRVTRGVTKPVNIVSIG
ncbi:MAG TPA: AraD1 family protein [Candidatus Acidoferrales bacterium]|nr:AraD1 family protein [Candidatus Acidoferrales bacterium]